MLSENDLLQLMCVSLLISILWLVDGAVLLFGNFILQAAWQL